MKRILFLTCYASPYRVNFFDELGKTMDVTVLYSEETAQQAARNAAWFVQGEGRFRAVQLGRRVASHKGENLCLEILDWLRKPYDAIVICGYSSPTNILAMTWLRLHRIPFYMEVDGGLIRQDGKAKYLLKKRLVTLADHFLSTSAYTTDFLVHYGAKRENVTVYPFSSLWAKDILTAPVTRQEKTELRQELGIRENRMILTIGQFIHRKGFDILLKAAQALPEDTAVCIVGGEATEEYLQLRQTLGLGHVYFQGFQKKETLTKYYRAADLFVLPTREDIWGLVINEAMAYGLPVVTTDRCVAGLELVEPGTNGTIVPVEDVDALAEAMGALLNGNLEAMGAASLRRIQPYTIENMARVHEEIFERG